MWEVNGDLRPQEINLWCHCMRHIEAFGKDYHVYFEKSSRFYKQPVDQELTAQQTNSIALIFGLLQNLHFIDWINNKR